MNAEQDKTIPHSEPSERLWTPRFITLSFVNFLMFTSFFFLTPTLPIYLVEELQAQESQVGLLIAVFTLAAVVSRPLTGYFMDKSSHKKVFVLAVIIFLMATIGYLWVKTLAFFMLVRLIHGFGFGMATTAGSTMAAEWIPANRRGEGIGYFGMFVVVAMALGPLVAVYLVEMFTYTQFFGICVFFAALGVILAMFLRPPTKIIDAHKNKNEVNPSNEKNESIQPNEEKQENSLTKLKSLFYKLFEPKAFPISLCVLLIAIVFGGTVTFIPLYAVELGGSKLAGAYFSLYALALVFSRPLAGKWFDRRGPFLIVLLGGIIYFIGIITLGLATGPALLYIAAVIIGIGYGSLQPSYQALVIAVSPENRRGAATATFFSSFDIGIGLGAVLSGLVVQWVGYGSMFLIFSGFILVSLTLFLIYHKRSTNELEINKQS
ncbi:MFS transporter [Bacillus horti]|uniref:MFS family permease n=1 Tax=Caldalkalibacillus horti TaxID=77523 RepID=A0ABT9VW93_9BACI|nr:MFS transporter [Bacillus horti]MDQ0165239.1 MFS family permease [Bacillus horti]